MKSELQAEWPQVFITQIIGNEDLPDVQILTLPGYKLDDGIFEIEKLAQLVHNGIEEFKPVGGSGIDYDPRAILAALHQVILDAHVRENMLPWNPTQTEQYAESIYEAHKIPIMNSALSGSSLKELVTAAGSGAAFMAAFPHDLGHITLYFVIVGGTRIVLGAADGISIGLKQGLTHVILKWMGVPKTRATPAKKKARLGRTAT